MGLENILYMVIAWLVIAYIVGIVIGRISRD